MAHWLSGLGLHFGRVRRSIGVVRKADVSLVPWVVRWNELREECHRTPTHWKSSISLYIKRKSLRRTGRNSLRAAARGNPAKSRDIDAARS
jgi:hypothetical protein